MLSILKNKTGPPTPGTSTQDSRRIYAERMVQNLLQTNPCFWQVSPTAESIEFTGFKEVEMVFTDEVGNSIGLRYVKAQVQLQSLFGLSLINEVTAMVPYDIDRISIQASIAYHLIVNEEERIMQALTSMFASQKNPEESRQRALQLLISLRWDRGFPSLIYYG